MRAPLLLLTVLFCTGCEPSGSIQNVDSTPPSPNEELDAREILNEDTTVIAMHPDAFIESLTDHPIDALHGDIDPSNPPLSVVPSGESYSRAKVFSRLGLDEARLRNFRTSRMNMVVFLTWQVSSSYDITCMSGTRSLDNHELEMADPERHVYGIRLSRTPR